MFNISYNLRDGVHCQSNNPILNGFLGPLSQ